MIFRVTFRMCHPVSSNFMPVIMSITNSRFKVDFSLEGFPYFLRYNQHFLRTIPMERKNGKIGGLVQKSGKFGKSRDFRVVWWGVSGSVRVRGFCERKEKR